MKLPLKLPRSLAGSRPLDCARRARFHRPWSWRVLDEVRIGVTFV